ncbi:MAG: homoserine kinase [Gemmatimonadaceae bacterium]
MTHHAQVRVPASTTNLGAGFDCVGMAIDRWLTASVTLGGATDARVSLERGGTLSSLAHAAEDDLLYRGFAAACATRKRPVPRGLQLSVTSDIPVARGLGSSAAALVAGARLADAVLGLALSREELATLCARIEGHADNVAAATFGGAVLVVPQQDSGLPYVYTLLDVHPSVGFAFAVPEFEITTAAARAVLPDVMSHADAVQAAGKSAALVRGLAVAHPRLLEIALDDVLHVPHRRGLVTGYDDVVEAARGAGAYGATLSGSGSTLVAIGPRDAMARVADAMRARWAEHGMRADTMVIAGPSAAAWEDDRH